MKYFYFILLAFFYLLTSTIAEIAARSCTRPNDTEIAHRGDGIGVPEIYEALITCPNITSLDLDFAMTGCVLNWEPWAFNFRSGDRFPALRKLSL